MSRVSVPKDDDSNKKTKREQAVSKSKQKNYQQALAYERAFLKKKAELEKSSNVQQLKDELDRIQKSASAEIDRAKSTISERGELEAELSRIRIQLADQLSKKQLELVSAQRRAEYNAHQFAAKCSMKAFESQNVHQRAQTAAILADAQRVQTEKLKSIRAAEIAELQSMHKVATSSGEKRRITLQINKLLKEISEAEEASSRYQQQASKYAEVVRNVDYQRLTATQKLAEKQRELKDLEDEASAAVREIDYKIEAKRLDIEEAEKSGNDSIAASLSSEVEELRAALDETERKYQSAIESLKSTIEGADGLRAKAREERGTRVQPLLLPPMNVSIPDVNVNVEVDSAKNATLVESDSDVDDSESPPHEEFVEQKKQLDIEDASNVPNIEEVLTSTESQILALLDYISNFVTSFESYVDILESRLNDTTPSETDVVIPQQGTEEVSKDNSKEVLSYLRTLISEAASDNIELQTQLTQRLDNLSNALTSSDPVSINVDPIVVPENEESITTSDVVTAIQNFKNELITRMDGKLSSDSAKQPQESSSIQPVTLNLDPVVSQGKLILDSLNEFVTTLQNYSKTVDPKLSDTTPPKIQITLRESGDASEGTQDILTYLKSIVEHITSDNTELQTQLATKLSDLGSVLANFPLGIEVTPNISVATSDPISSDDVIRAIQIFRESFLEKIDDKSSRFSELQRITEKLSSIHQLISTRWKNEVAQTVDSTNSVVESPRDVTTVISDDYRNTVESFRDSLQDLLDSLQLFAARIENSNSERVVDSEDSDIVADALVGGYNDVVTYIQGMLEQYRTADEQLVSDIANKLDAVTQLRSEIPTVVEIPEIVIPNTSNISFEEIQTILRDFLSSLNSKLDTDIGSRNDVPSVRDISVTPSEDITVVLEINIEELVSAIRTCFESAQDNFDSSVSDHLVTALSLLEEIVHSATQQNIAMQEELLRRVDSRPLIIPEVPLVEDYSVVLNVIQEQLSVLPDILYSLEERSVSEEMSASDNTIFRDRDMDSLEKLQRALEEAEEAFNRRSSVSPVDRAKFEHAKDKLETRSRKYEAEVRKEYVRHKFHDGEAMKDELLEETFKNLQNAVDGLADMCRTIDNNVAEYFKYQAEINAKLQGTSLDYKDMLSTMTKNLGMSMLVDQKEYIASFKRLVDAGIVHNMETRAFLATISNKVVNTFDAFDSSLLRLVRLQQNDSTAARLGLESTLNKLLNSQFSDSSYLGDGPHDSISSAILEASAMLTKDMSLEFEYIVHKWLGSLYSLGMSSDTLNKIAQGLNYLGTGNVSALNSNDSLQTLLAMSASKSGESYAEILTEGLDADTTNNLLRGMITYLMEIASNTDTTQVTKSAYSDLLGLNMSDMRAIQNLTQNDITALSALTTTYQESISETQNQLSSIIDRTHISTMIDNLFSNAVLGASLDIGKDPATYMLWKALNLVEGLTGGIALPFVNIFGSGLDLNTTVTQLAKSGIAGLTLFGNLLSSLGNGGLEAGMGLEYWNNNELTVRGTGTSFLASGTASGSSSSASISYAGSSSLADIKTTEMSDATDQAQRDAEITNKYAQEAQTIPEQTLSVVTDILDRTDAIQQAVADQDITLLQQSIRTYELLDDRLASLDGLNGINTLLAPSRIFLTQSMFDTGMLREQSNIDVSTGTVSMQEYANQLKTLTSVTSVFSSAIKNSSDILNTNVDIWSLISASQSLTTASELTSILNQQYTDPVDSRTEGFREFDGESDNKSANTQLINNLVNSINESGNSIQLQQYLRDFAEIQTLNKVVFPDYVRATIDELSPPVKKYIEELLRKAIETSLHGTDMTVQDSSTEFMHPIVRQLRSVLTDPTTVIHVEDSGF